MMWEACGGRLGHRAGRSVRAAASLGMAAVNEGIVGIGSGGGRLGGVG
jgi:hypothetical protein